MKRRILHLPLTLCLYLGLCSSCTSESKDSIVEDNLTFAQSQLRVAFDEIDYARTNETPESRKEREKKDWGELTNPRNSEPDGSLHLVPSKDWTSGFFRENCGISMNIRKITFGKRKHNSIQICLNGKR